MAKRRRKRTTAVRRRRSTAVAPVRRRKKRSSGLGAGMAAPFKSTMNAAIGGGIYGLVSPMIPASKTTKGLVGLGASFLMGYFGFPVMGNGAAGAAASDLVKGVLGGLSDDLQETEFTDVDLSDKELVTDAAGNVYALGENGAEPWYLGNMNDGSFDLSASGFDLSDYSGEQSVMMVPSFTS